VHANIWVGTVTTVVTQPAQIGEMARFPPRFRTRIGAWPAVLAAAGVSATSALLVADRR
jgi:hypothetical protein